MKLTHTKFHNSKGTLKTLNSKKAAREDLRKPYRKDQTMKMEKALHVIKANHKREAI